MPQITICVTPLQSTLALTHQQSSIRTLSQKKKKNAIPKKIEFKFSRFYRMLY